MAGELGGLVASMGIKMPENIGMWISVFGVGILLCMLVAGGAYFYIIRKKYNKKLELFKKVGGKIVKVGEDRMMYERIGLAGDYWAQTQKNGKILPRPKLEIAKNTFWYFEREDGEYINFDLIDIDLVMRQAKVNFIDEDMRLQRLGIQKNLALRLDKQGFWAKYGVMIGTIVFFLLITICLIVLFTRLSDLAGSLGSVAKSFQAMAEAMKDWSARTGSGMIQK